MKTYTLIAAVLFQLHCAAQPVTNSAVVERFTFDDSGQSQFEYSVSAQHIGEFPDDWTSLFYFDPRGASRIVVATKTRMDFMLGEAIDESRRSYTNSIPNPPFPSLEVYGVKILGYRSRFLDDWQYSAFGSASFNDRLEVILGIRVLLDSGIHFGWVKFGRSVIDAHTTLDVVGSAISPVPGEAISAGELPSLPPILPELGSDGLVFRWDPRWGSLTLQSATNIVTPVLWEDIEESTGGPIQMGLTDSQRFFRLRRP